MSQQAHSYEIALFGAFFSRDLRAVLTRCALHAERAIPFRAREVTFEPIDAAAQRDAGIEPVQLRARREIRLEDVAPTEGTSEDDSKPRRAAEVSSAVGEEGWILYSYLKPESERVHPEATVRPWAVTEVAGDGISCASALGYV